MDAIVKKSSKRKWFFLLVLLLLVFFLSLFVGRYSISPIDVWRILLSPIFAQQPGEFAIEKSVIIGIRLPRTLLTMLVGAGLSISGAAFQGLFRNPLVSPDILGVSAGAGFGAVLGILLIGVTPVISLFALPFGVMSVVLACLLGKIRNATPVLSLVLAGIVVSSVFSALISLIKYAADPYDKLPAIIYWLMGSFTKASYDDLKLVTLPVLTGITVLLLIRWRINVLSLGDEEAHSLGVNPGRLRWLIIAAVTVVTASAVTVAGIIGWVGLVIPHMGRMIVGVDHKALLPATVVIGATFLTFIDIVARTATAAEIPIGILTAIIGAPFFAFLLKKTKGGWL